MGQLDWAQVIGQFHPVVKVAQLLRSAGHGTIVSVGSDHRELVLGAMYVIPVGVVATGQEIVARPPLIHDSGGPGVLLRWPHHRLLLLTRELAANPRL